MVTSLEFTVPMPENLANARLHWRVKNRMRQEYFAALDALQGANRLPAPPERPFARATIRAVMHLGSAMDEGNAMHRCEKWPCDWLKTRGYIVDDRKKCLRWEAFPEQVIKRDGNYRVVLTLTPLEEEQDAGRE